MKNKRGSAFVVNALPFAPVLAKVMATFAAAAQKASMGPGSMRGSWFFRRLAAMLVCATLLPSAVLALSLALPVDCSETAQCFVQNYHDHDPSDKHADYACGPLSYDAHTGTDIRISYGDMERGVPVLAAADGVVRVVRDGEPEGEISLRGQASVKGREAGNAVVVVHPDGFETQYSHLKRGSVAVQPGQQVKAGQRLGLVGLSGATEFPHLEFSARHQGRPVDPFVGEDPTEAYGGERHPLWSREALESPVLAYRTSGLLEAGFYSVPPKDAISMLRRHDLVAGRTNDPSALVFGALAFGPRRGDVWTVRLIGPNGDVLAESRTVQERHQAQAMRYVGKKRGAGWTPGRYRGEFRLTRPGEGDVVFGAREIEIPK